MARKAIESRYENPLGSEKVLQTMLFIDQAPFTSCAVISRQKTTAKQQKRQSQSQSHLKFITKFKHEIPQLPNPLRNQ